MAATVNVTVTGTIVDGAGSPITSANVTAIRQNVSDLLSTTLASADIITATSNSSTGIFSLTLIGYDLCAVTYKIIFPDGQYMYLRLPPNSKSVGMGKITCGTSPAKSVKDITSQIGPTLKFIGQDLASATALPQPTCDIHKVTGTTTITSITATNFPVGKSVILIFAASCTVNDGNNLSLTGNLSMTADDPLHLVYDGTNFTQLSAPPGI